MALRFADSDHIVIASAALFETKELVERVGKASKKQDSKEQASKKPVTWINTGVGLTQSALVAASLRTLVTGRDVIFCCTGGVIGAFDQVKLYQAASIQLAPFDVRTKASYLISGFEPHLTPTFDSDVFELCDVYGSVGVATVQSGPSFDHDRGSTPVRPMLETLELYSVGRSWLPVAKSFRAFVVATNATDTHAHRDWQHHFKAAAMLTADLVSAIILKTNSSLNSK